MPPGSWITTLYDDRPGFVRQCQTDLGLNTAAGDTGDGLVDQLLVMLDHVDDFIRRFAGAVCKLSNLVGHSAKPRPCSPARAASMAALRANRLPRCVQPLPPLGLYPDQLAEHPAEMRLIGTPAFLADLRQWQLIRLQAFLGPANTHVQRPLLR